MGGIGKTELALQYAYYHLNLQTYSGGICWLRAKEDIGIQIVLFAQSSLDLSPPADLELTAKVAYCWQHWRKGSVLVVLDDVQDYRQVRSLLPLAEPRFHVLLTTRLKLQSPVQDFEIKVLSEEKALELLGALVERDRPDLRGFQNLRGLDPAKQICHWLGYLPLGIELVGRYLARKPETSLATLWQRLQDKRLEAKALKDSTPEMTASLGVAAAFELSWQAVDEPTQQLAALLSLFAPTEIPWTLVEACYPQEDAEEVEDWRDESLLNLHLLEQTGQGMYQLHQLLREFFAAKREQMATGEEMKQAICLVMVGESKKIPQTPTLEQIQQATPVIPHLAEAATTLKDWLADADLITPSTRIAWFYQGQAAYMRAKIWLEQCYVAAKTRFGCNHLAIAASLSNLAGLHFQQGGYSQAEPLLQQALKIFEHQLKSDHPLISTTLNNLAEIYREQGNYLKAELLYTKALKALEQQLGGSNRHVATNLNNLAELYRMQGRYNDAKPLYLRALAIRRNCLGADHLDVATSLDGLAALYQDQKYYVEAEPLHLRALAIRESKLIDDHRDVAASLNNLAELYKSQERYSEAEPLYLRAINSLLKSLGTDHSTTQTVQQNFCDFIAKVVQAGQTAQLSDDPVTQGLLRQMREGKE